MGLTTSSEGKISNQELKMVQDSWKVVMENPEGNGAVILKTFLERHDYYSKFEKFKGIPISELPENKTFRSHALAIIKTIDEITEKINNVDDMKSLLIKLGKTHKVRKITVKQFNELRVVILDILKSAFQLPEESVNAWNKTFDVAFAYVFEGLQDGES